MVQAKSVWEKMKAERTKEKWTAAPQQTGNTERGRICSAYIKSDEQLCGILMETFFSV